MNFDELLNAWQDAEMRALVAEEAVVAICQVETPEGHEMLAKAAELREVANRLFQEVSTQAQHGRN